MVGCERKSLFSRPKEGRASASWRWAGGNPFRRNILVAPAGSAGPFRLPERAIPAIPVLRRASRQRRDGLRNPSAGIRRSAGGVSGVKRIGGDHCRTVLFFRRRCEFPPLPPARRCLSQRNLSVFFSVPVGERADPTYTIPSTNPFRGGWSAAMDKAGKRSLVYGKRRKPQLRVQGEEDRRGREGGAGFPVKSSEIDG